MLSPEIRAKIYEVQQHDRWEFTIEGNGYIWTRTANNNEVVGMSHVPFASYAECIENAHMIGHENSYALPSDAVWEFYEDSRGDHRWRVVTASGHVINRSHTGYKSILASQKNAARHGHGLRQTVSENIQHASLFANAEKVEPLPMWLRIAILLLFIATVATGLLYANTDLGLLHKKSPVQANAPECTQKLVALHIVDLDTYETKDGVMYNTQVPITLAELAHTIVQYTHNAALQPQSLWQRMWKRHSPQKSLEHAKKQHWQYFTQEDKASYSANATKAAVARTVIDALTLSIADTERLRILKPLGTFNPNQAATKQNVIDILCNIQSST
jgi:uncharacterized protein YegP (UPF0339 family)